MSAPADSARLSRFAEAALLRRLPSLAEDGGARDAAEQIADELRGPDGAVCSPDAAESAVAGVLADYGIDADALVAGLIAEDVLEAAEDEVKAGRLLEGLGGEEERDDEEDLPPGYCELCARGPMRLTFHHLIPKKTHKKLLKRGIFSKSDLARGAALCRPCHSAVHRLHPHEDLALNYNTVELLLADPEVQRWVAYAGKQKIRQK
ncbi:hypothetical protein DFJ74DRAFT_710263 [Hyaloraphidium curvatum]|nr:hypothetical protein DFJ74DRAFT_710263 [Hyaloraphidium curvatum]